MTEYSVLFATKISANSKNELYEKAEETEEKLSKCLKKRIYAHSFAEIEKKDTIKQTTLEMKN